MTTTQQDMAVNMYFMAPPSTLASNLAWKHVKTYIRMPRVKR